MLMCPPGVYPAQADTEVLIRSLRAERLPASCRVLDVGTGCGAVAVAAALRGATVTAVDISRWALATTFVNSLLARRRIAVRHGDLFAPVRGSRFDLIVANPPYVPAPSHETKGLARAWDAGPAGRDLLDRLCRQSPSMLAAGGVLLLVQSSLADVPRTCRLLAEHGLRTEIRTILRQPFGPVMSARADWFEQRGLIGRGQREEDLVVVRGVR